jgi:cytochrome c biogenesis protein CcmG/thiol:disulfide interchange protein DsbE
VKALKFGIPLAIFLGLVVFFAIGLTRDPREVPSPLIDKPAPAFRQEQLADASLAFAPEQMKGQVWMLNVWASWCGACRVEHPVLLQVAKQKVVPIVGLNWKDERGDALQWLAKFGDPYALSVHDRTNVVGLDYGVYGAPETFLIDKQGVIRYKQIGPITPEAWEKTLLPMIRKLQA